MNSTARIWIAGTVATATALAAGVALGVAWSNGRVMNARPEMDDTAGVDGTPGTSGQEGSQDMQGMDMDGASASGTVHLSPDDLATFGITFGTAEVRLLVRSIRAVGVVGLDETRMVYVAPKFGGWIERLHADFTGQAVRRGQPLVDVYSPDLVTAQEELLLAARMAESVDESRVEEVAGGARELVASARRRLEYWDISEEQVERLRESGEVNKTLTLHAPMSGIVMEKDAVEGQAFAPGRNLYMIADLSEVWVNAEVFEADAGLVREGMTAQLEIAALPGHSFVGRVEYVYPTLEERTRSMRARIALPNPAGRLRPGMYGTVRLTADIGETLTVPATAVLHSGERAVAFVDMGGGALMPHELQLGVRGGDYVQVISGVAPGQRVVTSAQFLLDSESNLAEVMRAMMSQMGLSDTGRMEGMDMGGQGSMEGMEIGGQSMAPARPDSGGGR